MNKKVKCLGVVGLFVTIKDECELQERYVVVSKVYSDK
jgi:hypothetical protein